MNSLHCVDKQWMIFYDLCDNSYRLKNCPPDALMVSFKLNL